MEFKEKLQQLRKEKGLTQEELARQLFVSRTAISKWESGRGFPNIESLKALSKCFHISLDELLSGEELLAFAEADRKKKLETIGDLVFGLLDCGAVLLLFLPLFGQKGSNGVHSVSLLELVNRPYLRGMYFAFACAVALLGVLTLALQNCRKDLWLRSKRVLSLVFAVLGVCLFIISRQPYAAVFVFAFLIIKVFLMLKKQ